MTVILLNSDCNKDGLSKSREDPSGDRYFFWLKVTFEIVIDYKFSINIIKQF